MIILWMLAGHLAWLLVVLEKRIPLSRHEALIYLLQAWLLGPLVWVCLSVKISLSKRSTA